MSENTPLLAPGPLVSLLERLSKDLSVLERTVPSNDATTLLREFEKSLNTAIEEASQQGAFVSIEQLHKLTGRPESTLRRLCSRHGEIIGAWKISNAWTVDRRKFEKAWRSGTLEMESAA